jgi:hypothetical protein
MYGDESCSYKKVTFLNATHKGNSYRLKRKFFYVLKAKKAIWIISVLKIGFSNVNLCPVHSAPDILTLAYKQAPLQEQMTLLHEKEQMVPGTVQYSIRRFRRHNQWNT